MFSLNQSSMQYLYVHMDVSLDQLTVKHCLCVTPNVPTMDEPLLKASPHSQSVRSVRRTRRSYHGLLS